MLVDFEKELIYLIDRNYKDILVSPYLGEFSDMKEFEKCLNSQMQILVDFESQKYINKVEKLATYKIYFISRTSNKSANYRQKAKFELLNLVEDVDQLLLNHAPKHGYGISLESLNKTFTGVSDYGYLYIMERTITTQMPNRYFDDMQKEDIL